MIETARHISRNVKRWQPGDMCRGWTAAGMLEAQAQDRRVIGHGDLAKLTLTGDHDVATKRAASITYTPVTTAAPEVTAQPHLSFTQRIAAKVPRQTGHPLSHSDHPATERQRCCGERRSRFSFHSSGGVECNPMRRCNGCRDPWPDLGWCQGVRGFRPSDR
jgi:hypothetical protein